MDRRQFIQLSAISGSLGLITPQLVLAEPTSLIGAGGLFYTKEVPGRWKDKEASHLPQMTKHVHEEGKVMIHMFTDHKMLAYKHYIVKHVLLDSQLQFLDEKMFNPETDDPVSMFELANYSGTLYALSVCNQHDAWLSMLEV